MPEQTDAQKFCVQPQHAGHSFGNFFGRTREGLYVDTRRSMLKAGMAGMAGLSLPGLLQAKAEAAAAGISGPTGKSVILLWMAGGPSHIDTWDSKPDRPWVNRGPFGVTKTKLPGVVICEHLPKQAAMLDKFTIIRSVDARHSNHEPNMVFQTANLAAEPRVNPEAVRYPSLASVIAKSHGANHPAMPPFAAFMKSRSHLAFAGYLGKQYDPFLCDKATALPVYTDVGVDTGRTTGGDLFQMPKGLSENRLNDRVSLLKQFDHMKAGLDQDGSMDALNTYQQQAVDLLLGERARQAFDLKQEDAETRERYGKHLWCQQALIARRLVEAGTTFVTLDLSYHGASGTWDNHGDNIPPYGGISKGLGPLLPPCRWRIAAWSGNRSYRKRRGHNQGATGHSSRSRGHAVSLLRSSSGLPVSGSPGATSFCRGRRFPDRGVILTLIVMPLIQGCLQNSRHLFPDAPGARGCPRRLQIEFCSSALFRRSERQRSGDGVLRRRGEYWRRGVFYRGALVPNPPTTSAI